MKEQPTLKLRILFSGVLFLFIIGTLNAQQQHKTPYQHRIGEITQKYFKLLYGYNKQLTVYDRMQLDMITDGEEASGFILGVGILGYAANHSETDTKRLLSQIKIELKQAERLKTAVDFKREANKKLEAARKKREAERNRIQDQFEKTDAGKIQAEIRDNYYKWLSKGEFEKNADYEIRKEKLSKETFFEICNSTIKNRIKDISNYDLKTELLPYDSENEVFSISFSLNDLNKWQNTLKIPIKDAENFKNEWDVKWEQNLSDWCLIDNYLYPTKITLSNTKNESQYRFVLPLSNQKNIIVAFNGLGLENVYTKDVVFDFSTGSVKKSKQEIKDSLDNAFYDNKIDSVFNAYNREILNNHFNIDKETLSIDNKPIIDKENPDKNESFDLAFEKLKNTCNEFSEELENKFNLKRDSTYLQYSEYFPNRLEFNTLYEEGGNVAVQKAAEITRKENMYSKYSEYFPNKSEFNILYIQGENIVIQKVENLKKRDKMYVQYSELFPIKAEFDSVYEQGESVVIERVKDLKTLKTLGECVKTIQSINFMKVDEYGIQELIKNCKDRKIYPEALKIVFDNNKGISKMWEKEGMYFYNQSEFYESYTSGDYKKILKEKKKKI